jgi:MFS family permease
MPFATPPAVRLGLRANWAQFGLLVLVNAFVGGMIGLERTVVPLLAGAEFGLASSLAALSFILSFGAVKALTNLVAGGLSDRFGRKRVLIAGWLNGLPAPLLVMLAPTWDWVVAANVLLGVNQGLCWSATVIMKIDLVGPARRGLAMGLNEAAGYGAVALAALAAGYVAAATALRPQPFYLGLAFGLAGLLTSLLLVRETRGHAHHEAALTADAQPASTQPLSFGRIVWLTSWRDRRLFAVSQAGLVNNLNDGVAWGLLPLYFAAAGLSLEEISLLAAAYPAVWSLAQLGTGALSDWTGRKPLIVAGMWLQAAGLALFVLARGFWPWLGAATLLGLGTALVYPTLLAAIGDRAHPSWRASAVGVYRLWRDSGYVVGALLAGLLADQLGMGWAVGAVAGLTGLSGAVVAVVMGETLGSSQVVK